VRVCTRMRACVCARVRACVRVCVRACVWVQAHLLLTSLRGSCYTRGTQDDDLHDLGFPKRSATISFFFWWKAVPEV